MKLVIVSIATLLLATAAHAGPPSPGGSPISVQLGSSGQDFSVNKPSLPNVGATFGSTGPYANYVLIATLPADPSRNSWIFQNQSSGQVVLVFDDGTAGSGVAPANTTVMSYSAAATSGGQGAADGDLTFKGRIQVYAPSASAQIALAKR